MAMVTWKVGGGLSLWIDGHGTVCSLAYDANVATIQKIEIHVRQKTY